MKWRADQRCGEGVAVRVDVIRQDSVGGIRNERRPGINVIVVDRPRRGRIGNVEFHGSDTRLGSSPVESVGELVGADVAAVRLELERAIGIESETTGRRTRKEPGSGGAWRGNGGG